ncbi:peptidyl-prolyl cis-trans isomerase FKBP43-like isoform X3 [Vicia villosa]|uniref:peptidyl-prolyl cis-trans isomerase FKBP43-like isoform X3 n=1 Tax=Vicia villosa TaxID=3911 RepID=UPI00273C5D63|nr:peptidyl-prolyl cis-trans isomerase FKBP43-like isoform X3 [Vicia villosa]
MAFWGVEIKPGKPFTHQHDASRGRLHISIATLGLGTAITKSTLQCNVGNKSPVFLCVLYPGKSESLQLNLEFEEYGNVVLSVIGPRSIHLCGYYLARGHYTNTMGESESYGEDIADTETERSDHSDEDDYDDSFIDDDDTVFPPSPIFNEEEASSDSGRKVTKGSRRRLRKKYQLVESDDNGGCEEKKTIGDNMHVESQKIDDQDSLPISSICKNKASGRVLDQEMDDNVDKETVGAGNKDGEDREDNTIGESDDNGGCEEKKTIGDNMHVESQKIDDQDSLPISSICKNKASGRVLDQEMDDNVDKETVGAGNKDGEDREDNTIETTLKTDNVVVDSQTHSREAEPSDQLVEPCSVLDVGDIKKSIKKKKEKEKETKSSCHDHSTELDNAVQDEPKMNTSQNLLAGNEQNQQQADDKKAEPSDQLVDPCPVLEVGDIKKSKKKKKEKETKSSANGHSAEIGNAVQDEPKMNTTQDLLEGNEQNQHQADDKKVETTDKILPSSQVGQGQDEKPKRKRKERSKEETLACISNVTNLPQAQGNEHNSQDTVNGDVKISDTVALPSTETDSQKKTKKRKKEHLNKASQQPEGDNGNGEANKETVESDSLIDKFSERKEQHPKLTIENNMDNNGNQSEDKKVKKKKKSKNKGNEVVNSDVPLSIEPSTVMTKEDGNNTEDAKSSQVRTLSDGLVIQELETGKANGKIAALGKKISINYTGKLKENGVVVESNAGEAPFKFRLGKGEVIKGWDIGLEGMQVGEKRRLVIPPSMTSKNDGDSGSIPPNSWLVYDFELVKVH